MRLAISDVPIASMIGRRKERKEVKSSAGVLRGEEGTACKDAIVFLVFFVHQTNVNILIIGQILRITQSVVLIGQRPVIREHRSSHIIQNSKSCVNIFTQYFAAQLPYVTFRFTWQTLQTSLQLFSCFGPASFSFFHPPKIFKLFHFRTQKN